MCETDLLIVGGGTAGLAAAVTASELRLPKILVEKTGCLGGQLHWSFGQFSAAGTRRQRDRGIHDSPDEHYDDVMRIGSQLATPHVVRLAVDAAPGMVDWLEDLGFPFADGTPALVHGHEVYTKPRTYWGGDDRLNGGLAILRTLEPRVAEPVDVRLGTRIVDLLHDERGVRGAVAEGPCGREEIRARETLLTTGGYAANRDLLARMQPEWPTALVGCRDHATGDGHELLARVFGTPLTHGSLYVPTMGLIEDPDRPGFGFPLHVSRLIVNANERDPWEIWVNRAGKRFVAEDTSSPHEREHALLDQPDLAMAAIWDRHAAEQGPAAIGPGWTRADEAAEADRGRWLHRSDSLPRLATALGVDPAGMESTVRTYNDDVRVGRADPLGRSFRPAPIETPPYYGVVSRGGMLLTRGGPEVDRELRPLDRSRRPIRGLRVAGELIGMSQFSGDAFAGGMSIGPALSLGRWTVQRFFEELSSGE